jgi:AAA ATPase domain
VDYRDDPYTPGSGVRPPMLAGRDNDLDAFEILMARVARGQHERSLVYSGLRGVGKTVLLREFELRAREAGWVTHDVEEVGSGDFRLVFGDFAYQVLLAMSRKERMRDRARRALGVLKSFSIHAPGGVAARLEIDIAEGSADTGDPERDLASLLVAIGETAQAGGTGALFLLDEMQGLEAEALAAICMAMNKIGQRSLPVAIVGAGLPPLPVQLRQAKPYAERLFAYSELDRLPRAAARSALVGPAAVHGVEFEPEAVELVLDGSHGYPYFIQEYGRVLWREIEASPITANDVQAVEETVRAALDRRFFKDRFDSGSDAEQRYLAAMADLGDGPVRSAEIAVRAGYSSSSSASLARDGLMKKDLVFSPRRGLLDFTVPRFGEYLRRSHPLDDLLEP